MHTRPKRIKIATRQIVTAPNASAAALVRGITRSTNSTHALCQHGHKESSSGRACTSFRGLILIWKFPKKYWNQIVENWTNQSPRAINPHSARSNDDKPMYDARHQSIQSQQNISLLSVWLKFSSPITCSIKIKNTQKRCQNLNHTYHLYINAQILQVLSSEEPY
jgi:hypothetical protein